MDLTPLLQETLLKTGRLRLRVRGTSMEPALPAGCIIEARPVPASLHVGDIVLFHRSDDLVAHRLVAHTAAGWLTRGDAVAEPDPPITEDQILAVVAVVRAPNAARRSSSLLRPRLRNVRLRIASCFASLRSPRG